MGTLNWDYKPWKCHNSFCNWSLFTLKWDTMHYIAQEAAKLLMTKFSCTTKIASRLCTCNGFLMLTQRNRASIQIFSGLLFWPLAILEFLKLWWCKYSTSFESHNKDILLFVLSKEHGSIFKACNHGSKYPYLHRMYSLREPFQYCIFVHYMYFEHLLKHEFWK